MPAKTPKNWTISRSWLPLTERLDNLRREMERLSEHPVKLGILEQQVTDLRNKSEETSRRRWSVVPALIGGLVGALATLLVQTLIKHLA